jgi:UDP-GlcNAc3NAcA epimerase
LKIVTVLGARPQFIKAAAVSREISGHADIEELIVHTGQHFDDNMSEVFFREMHIPKPRYHFDIHGLTHGAMTGQMLESIEKVLMEERPDWVLVYGDTNTTLAGALAAAKLHVPAAHVEAGLRSFNMRMPEEINRILADRVSSLLCCPTKTAVRNLEREGFRGFKCAVELCGDVMQDAALFYARESEKVSKIRKKLGIEALEYALCTVHRAENTDDHERLAGIISGLARISRELPVILPIHPRTRHLLEKEKIDTKARVIEPVGYLEMLDLLKHCTIVLTDSGGLQKEAYFFAKPCVTLREETEWTELVEHGCNLIVGTDPERIFAGYRTMRKAGIDFGKDLYGGGRAASRVVEALKRHAPC